MLTEPQSLPADNLSLRLIIADDGRTLLAVTGSDEGSLELLAAPVSLIQPNGTVIAPFPLKVNNGGAGKTQSFNVNLEGGLGSSAAQQTTFLPLPNYEHAPSIEGCDRTTGRDNDKQLTEIVSSPSFVGESTTDLPEDRKRGPGRPRKNTDASANIDELKCEICGEQFKKRMTYRKHMDHHAAEKSHRCPKCPASFNIPSNFTLHMSTHNAGEPKCPECGRKFARMATLKSHIGIHEKEENLFCTECEDTFATKAQLDAHLKLHKEKWSSEDVRKCKLCNKQFTQPALYRLHIREHYRLQTKIMKQTKRGTIQKTIYKCKICMKVFQKPSQLMRHIRVHTGEKPFKCSACPRAFSQKSSLQIHLWQHVGVRPYVCTHCNARFSQKGNLNAHIRRVHSISEGHPTYACSQCSCVYKKLGSLNGHLKKMHTKSSEGTPNSDSAVEDNLAEQKAQSIIPVNVSAFPSSKSDILQQALTNSGLNSEGKPPQSEKPDSQISYVTLIDRSPDDSIRKYVTIKQRRIGSIRWYVCSVCHKEFKKPSDLIRHLRVHTQEKPFKCSQCPRTFSLKSTVKGHEKTHFAIKKYTCGLCGKMFTCHSSLNAHTRTHTKPHKCDKCNMSFSTSTLLKTHMRAHLKTKSERCPEAEKLAPLIVLEEPLLISDADNKISVAQVQTKQKYVYNAEEEGARPHKCWVCPAAFRKISHLKQHYRRHTGERPYKCSKCDRRFTSNSVLKAHLHTHEEARPFSCNVCDATFSTLSSQKRHLVTHSTKRPFMCPYCHKTFKTSVNCRKHMKVHKNELAQQQLKKKKSGDSKEDERQQLNLETDLEFQGNVSTDFDQAFGEQLGELGKKNKEILEEEALETVTLIENVRTVDSENLDGSQTLHADETGTITLANYTGEQTAESIREIEETLNQQLCSISLGSLQLPSSLVRHMTDSTSGLLTSSQQPILNIIYDGPKVLEPLTPASLAPTLFGSPHFDTFDMSQITLQADTEIDLGISSANSTSMASILPRSAQEEQRMIPVTACPQPFQTKPQQVVVVPLPQSQELHPCPKYSKIIAKVDTTDANDLFHPSNEPTVHKSLLRNLPETHEPLSSVPQSEHTKIRETSLECHLCLKKGFTAISLKRHLKSHQASKQFQCPACSLQFCTNGGLTRHRKIHNQEIKCMEVFSTDLQLETHIETYDKLSCTTSVEPENSEKSNAVESENSRADDNISVSEKILRNSYAKQDIVEMMNGEETKEKKEYMNKCEYCPKTFRKPSDLIRHVRTHTGERPYQCPHCEKSFAVKCTLDSHVKVHEGTKYFCCHVCNSRFATKGSLSVHMRLHTGAKPFKCAICDQRFRTSGHRKVHQITHTENHKNEKKRLGKQKKKNSETPEIIVKTEAQVTDTDIEQSHYPSISTVTIDANAIGDQLTFNPDGTIVNNNSVLSVNESNQLVANLHFLLSNGLVTIQTDEAALLQLNDGNVNEEGNLISQGETVIQENLGENHCESVDATFMLTEKAFPIDQEQAQVQLDNCVTLVGMATDETQFSGRIEVLASSQKGKVKSQMSKECDICGKTFTKPCQVERHKRIHTGEKPFKCNLCNKSFAQKVTLQLHHKHHTGEKPYSCPNCDNSFTQKGNLRSHMRRVHKLDSVEIKKSNGEYQINTKVPQNSDNQINVNRLLSLDGISLVEFLK